MKIKKIFSKKNLLWFVFIFIFILVASEIFGRIYLSILQKSVNPKFQFDSYRIYAHIPNFKEGDGKRNWIEINGQGFRRSTEVSKEKPKNTFRAFLMGGSAAHGALSAAPYPIKHLYNDETVDACIEKMLKDKYPNYNFEIINAAVTGYQVFQHTNYILAELFDYNPDLFIFLDGANDYFTYNPDFDYYANNRYQFWKPRLQHPSVGGMIDYFFLDASKYSAFAKGYVAWILQRDAFKNNDKSDMTMPLPNVIDSAALIHNHRMVAPKQFLRNIDINVLMLKNYNIGSILCFQPMLSLRDKNSCSPAEQNFYIPSKPQSILYPVIISELDSLAGKEHVSLVDVVPHFNDTDLKGKQLFIDYAHYTPEGSLEVAKAIFPAVDKYFRERMLTGQDSSLTHSVQ